MARPPKDAPATVGPISSGANRLSVPLTPDGGIDWDGMRPSTRARLLSMTGEDATILESIGMAGWVRGNPDAPDGDGGAFPAITEENIRAAIDLLSQSNALIFRMGAARWIKHPLKRTLDGKPVPFVMDMDILTRAFTMTDAQHKELDPRALRLAKKYTSELPDWIKKNLDVYMLAAMYLKYTADNAKTAMGLQIQRDIANAVKAQGHVAATARPVDSDARTPSPAPGNGHAAHDAGMDNAQPGATFSPGPESFEPGSDAAIAP
jgi:hypothetical protein